MTNITKNKIYDKMQQLDEYLKYLRQLSREVGSEKQFINDFHYFGTAERYLQLSIQTVIDTVQLVIVDSGLLRPEDNQESISLLYKQKIISKNVVKELDGIVGFRNILVHEYGKIDRKKVYFYLQEQVDSLRLFRREILKHLKNGK
jgi:uncharacterized protein YutE (UPF0331/DUF86 family)